MVLLKQSSPHSHRPLSRPSQHPPAAVAVAVAAARVGIAGVFIADGTLRIGKMLKATTPLHLTALDVAEGLIGQAIGGSWANVTEPLQFQRVEVVVVNSALNKA